MSKADIIQEAASRYLDEWLERMSTEEGRLEEIKNIAKALAENKFTWTTMSVFNEEEHRLIDKYTKEYEEDGTI